MKVGRECGEQDEGDGEFLSIMFGKKLFSKDADFCMWTLKYLFFVYTFLCTSGLIEVKPQLFQK